MSADQHEQAANREVQEAKEHAGQFDQNAWSTSAGGCQSFCFDTWSNPTSAHAQRAHKHRVLAAKHRRASETLRTTENELCVGISDRDRDVSPFFHFADIASVDAESDPFVFTVRFKPITGLDAAAMQRLIDCHIARNAVAGLESLQMDFCPLVPKGVRAKVRGEESAVVVELAADSPTSRDEVRARLLRLQERLR